MKVGPRRHVLGEWVFMQLVGGNLEREAAAWDRVVDDHIELVWTTGRDAGLDDAGAAIVSQVTWLRLAQRWHSIYPGISNDDAARAELRDWITSTARDEVQAIAAQRLRCRGRWPTCFPGQASGKIAGKVLATPDA
jgi:hypothetical protein